jgi:hypothetical protein
MKTSETIGSLITALAAAQKSITNPAFDKVNPHFKSRYATLAAHLDAIRLPFAAEGLFIMQPISSDRDTITVTTRIAHKSGEWIEESATEPRPERCTIQQFGSICSYLRRYTLASMVSITGEDDLDGEEVVAPTRQQARYEPHPSQSAPARTFQPRAPEREPEPHPSQTPPSPKPAPAPAPAPAAAPAAEADQHGEWIWIQVRFCDEKQSQGKTASPYLAVKTADDQRLTCWDTDLFDVIKSAHRDRSTIGVIVDTSSKFPKIVEVKRG